MNFEIGKTYQSKTHGEVKYLGIDRYMGESTYKFYSITYDTNCYWLMDAKSLSIHIDSKDNNTVRKGTMKYYIGVKPCGCIVSACVDNPEHKEDTAEFAKEVIEAGHTLKHVVSDEGPQLQTCKCEEKCDKTLDMFKGAKVTG